MIDVIIPAYNAHETIQNTIESIVRQKNKNKLKIYVVNDNSNQNYREIIKKYENVINIKEFTLKKNGGPGVARQYGIDHSNSEYIVFIDADDVFKTSNSLSVLNSEIEKRGADVIISTFEEELSDGTKVKHEDDNIWLHGKIYRREFIEKYNIRFNNTSANEDNGFNQLILLHDSKVEYIDKCTYIWKYNENSITRINEHEYLFSGLEGYIYNITWALNIAIEHDCDYEKISTLAFIALIAIYYYYLEYLDKKDVEKLIEKSAGLYNIHKRYPIESEERKKELWYEQFLFSTKDKDIKLKLNPPISLDEFFKKIDNNSIHIETCNEATIEKNMIIAMCCTENWYSYLIVDLFALLSKTKNIKKIYLLVETDNIDKIFGLNEIKKRYKIEIKMIKINNYIEKYLDIQSPNRDTIYSNFCFGRLLLSEIVEEDKILYIDTDAIVRKDISDVWNYDISEYYVAGVRDYGILADNTLERLDMVGKHYINSGFTLFNLKKIREEGILKKWFELINKEEMVYPDQDALNLICKDKELYLPSVYNFRPGVTLDVNNKELIKVFHFMGPKKDWVVNHFYSEEWYDEYEKFCDEFDGKVNKKELTIAMCCSKKWYKYLVISLFSLFKNTKNIKKVYLFVESENIDEIPYLRKLKNKFKINIKLININKEMKKILNRNMTNLNKKFTNYTLGRLLIPDLIKEKKVVYIDTDVIIKNDISGVMKYDMQDNYIAGVKDYGIYDRKKFLKKYIKGNYIQAGFSVWNLAKMREDNIHYKCFDLINEIDLPYPVQDALNIICKDHITYIPSMYNICNNITLEVLNEKLAKVYHYAGEKEEWVVDKYYAEEWYEIEEEFNRTFTKNTG